MKINLFVLLILPVFASEKNENAENGAENAERIWNNQENSIVVKIEEDEYIKVNKKSKFIGVSYDNIKSKWHAKRWSKNEKKQVSNGYYDDEETAAHASDTLARQLMKKGNQKLKLNFPEDHTEVYPENGSKYIGVSYDKEKSKWRAQRRSKYDKKAISNGYHDDEETAAHASDTLARKLMENGELKLKLNFPDDYTDVYSKETSSKFIGVSYNKIRSKWQAQRWSKNENKTVYNGCLIDDEETAAHASDTLARKLMKNGEQNLKLNFPENYTEVYSKETSSKFIGVSYNKIRSKWQAQRRSKIENKTVSNGYFNDEGTAAHASDTLARKLLENADQNHKLNFPDDHTEVYPEEKSSKFIGVSYNKINSKWKVQRRSKNENTMIFSGYHNDEETAAHASDTLARKLMENGEQKLKLNFPDDYTEVYPEENQNKKRKRPNHFGLEHPQIN